MRLATLLIVCSAVLHPQNALAQRGQQQVLPTAVRKSAETIEKEKLAAHLAVLTADGLGGRLTPSPGLDSAVAYVTSRVLALKLQPAGDSGTFLQRHSIQRRMIDTAATFIEVDGVRYRAPGSFVVGNLRQFQAPPGDVRVVAPVAFVGHGFVVPSRGIDPYAGIDFDNRILLAWGPGVPKGIAMAEWSQPGFFSTANWWKAPAILWIPPFARFSAWWNRLRGGDLSLAWYGAPIDGSNVPRSPWINVGPDLLEALLAGEATDARTVFARSMAGDSLPSFALSAGRQVTINIVNRPPEILHPASVIAKVEGRDPILKNEFVVLQAHLDGVADLFPVSDSIINAADDNASGVVALLGVAEALARAPRARRTIVLLWDTGEERDNLGTKEFIARNTVPLDKIVTHFNIDMVGRSKNPADASAANQDLTGPNEVYVVGPRTLSSELDRQVESVNNAFLQMTLNHRHDTWSADGLLGWGEHAYFWQKGVPTVFWYSGMHQDYHSTTDNPDKIDIAKLERIARTVFATAWALAESPSRPIIDRRNPSSR